MMVFTARQIADYLGGTIEGDENVEVSQFSKIEEGKEGSLSFLANLQYKKFIYETKSSIVLINNDLILDSKVHTTLIRVENAYQSLAKLLQLYDSMKPQKTGIDSGAFISASATVEDECYIGTFAYIGDNSTIGQASKIYPQVYIGNNVQIGKNVTLFPGVKIYDDCIIGDACTIHSGAVIGSDGFGFAPNSENEYSKVPQIGKVILEDHVEIGANTTVDRATMGATVIKRGVKLDNLIQIAHNVEVANNTVIAAQTGIAGSTKVGKNCMIGGQVGINGHISIADGVRVAAQSGISSDIKEAKTVQGAPAFDYGPYQKSYVMFKKLPEIYKQINSLQREIEALKNSKDKA